MDSMAMKNLVPNRKIRVWNRQQLQKHLDAANEAAIRKDTDMEDFLANISHEFRTPINAVTGLSSLLLKRGNQEELRSIHSAGERLAAQVEDILDYTEISGGQVMVSNDRYTVEAFIHTIIQRERGALFARGLEFVVDIGHDCDDIQRVEHFIVD